MNDETLHRATMQGLAAGLTVGMIATRDLACCGKADDVEAVLNRKDWQEFDAIPVKDSGKVVAVIERGRRQKRALDGSILVAEAQSLERFLMGSAPDFVDDGYRLVLTDNGIEGIVTPSDLLRLPVRVLAFALLAQLELTMDRAIKCEPDHVRIVSGISEKGMRQIKQLQRKLAQDNLFLDDLSLTSYSDKVDILASLEIFDANAIHDAGKVEKLRHEIMHQREYVRDRQTLEAFLEQLGLMRLLIERLNGWIAQWVGNDSAADAMSPEM